MVQKRRERVLRTAALPLGTAPAGHQDPSGYTTVRTGGARVRGRDRVVAIGAAATLAAVAGVAGWQLIEGDSDSRWAAQAQARLGSVDQQLALLAQTTQRWQTQPADVVAAHPDVAAALTRRNQELAHEQADLTAELDRYRQLPALRARAADDDARVEALQRQLDARGFSPDQTARDQIAAQLDAVRAQRAQDAADAQATSTAIAAAKAAGPSEDSAKTTAVLGAVTAALDQPAATPQPAPPSLQIEAAGPNLPSGALAAAGGQPALPPTPFPGTAPAPGASGLAPAGAGQPRATGSSLPTMHTSAPAPVLSPLSVPERQAPAVGQVPMVKHEAPHVTPARGATDVPVARTHSQSPQTGKSDEEASKGAADPIARQPAPVSEQPAPLIEQPAPADPAPVITEAAPAQPSPSVPSATPRTKQQQHSSVEDQQRSLPAALPRTQVPTSERANSYEPQRASSRASLPSEDQVKEWTGDKEIARQSQTPEGQALMRSLLGGDGGDGSTATDRASVRRDASRSDDSEDSSSTASTDNGHSKSHKSRTASDSASNSGSDGAGGGTSGEDSGNAEGGADTDSGSGSGSGGKARRAEHSGKKSSGKKSHSSSGESSSGESSSGESSSGESSSDGSSSSESSSDDSD